MIRTTLTILALTLAWTPGSAAAQEAPSSRPLTESEVDAWREDLRVLASELPRRHPMPFAGLTPSGLDRQTFDEAVRDLDARIPSLSRHEVVVGLQRIVALVGDGHTSINPRFDPAIGFHYLPLELHAFSDGIFVRTAERGLGELVGARVVRIGDRAAGEALAAVGEVVSHENEPFLREHGTFYLTIPEVLHALGITAEPDAATLVLEKGGREWTATVRAAGLLEPRGHDPRGPIDTSDWVNMRPPEVDPPLWLSRQPELQWVDYQPATKTLYVAYQSSHSGPHDGEPIPAFLRRVFALADSVDVERFVLDVRDNMGGESFYNRQLLLGVIRRPALDREGTFFTVIGRGVYSAAQNLVNDLERYTNVTFVGEPTGSPPGFFGDHDPLVLPNSAITVRISTLWWAPRDPRDDRPFTAPRLFVEPSSEDYRAGRDPVLEAIDAWLEEPPLADRLMAALEAPDPDRLRATFEAYRALPSNRYAAAAVEADVNALGYHLLRAGRGEDAVRVFRLNVAAYPGSANVHDSLAEAYEHMGRLEKAAALYRRALAIDPRMGSSREGLRRLGVLEE